MKKNLLCYLVILIMCGLELVAWAEEPGVKTPIKAALRSLALPGWGQFYNKQQKKGLIMSSTEIILVSGVVITQYKSDKTYDKYKTATGNEIESKYNNANRYHKTSNYLALSAVLFWGYSIVDAYFGSKEIESMSNLSIMAQDGKVVMLYNKSF